MPVIGRAVIEIVASTSKALKEIQGLKGHVEKVGQSMRKAGLALTAGVTVPMMGMAWKAVQAASDLEEATNKLRVVFGDAADELERMLADAPQRLAMARDAAYDAAANFGQLLQVAGLTREEAAKLSPQLLQLAADMASIHNIPVDQALYKLRAGLVGETEPLRTVGILLSETAVKLKALDMGLVQAQVDTVKLAKLKFQLADAMKEAQEAVKRYGQDSEQAQRALLKVKEIEQKIAKVLEGKVPQLTDAQKVMARYAIIMEQGAYMMGDLARTQDSVANSTRILQAEVRDLMAEVGRDLLPVVKDLLLLIRDWVRWFKALSPETRKAIVKVGALAAALGPVLTVVGQLISWGAAIAGFLGKFGAVSALLGKIGAGFAAVKTAIAGVLAAVGPVGWIILAIIGIITALYFAWKNNWLGMREPISKFVAALLNGFNTAVVAAQQLLFIVKYYAGQAWQWLIGTLKRAWNTVVMLWTLLSVMWNYIVSLVITKATELYSRVVSTIVRLVTTVVARWRSFRAKVVEIFLNFVARVVEHVMDFREKVSALFWETVNRVKSIVLGTDWISVGKNIIQGIIDGAKQMASALLDYFAGLARSALDAAKSVLGIKSPSREFMKVGQASIQGFVKGLEFVKHVPLPSVEIGATLAGPDIPGVGVEIGGGKVAHYHFHYQPTISLGDETEAERVLFPLFERWIRAREAGVV